MNSIILNIIKDPKFLAAVISLFLCFMIKCTDHFSINFSIDFRNGVFDVIFSLLSSYISAYIFYIVIDYIPFEHRKQKMKSLINARMFRISELIRLSKEIVLPAYSFKKKKYERTEYVKMFVDCDLSEDYTFHKNKTKLQRLEELKHEMDRTAEALLAYREYLDDAQYNFLIQVLKLQFHIEIKDVGNNEAAYDLVNKSEYAGILFDLAQMSHDVQNQSVN